MNTPASREIKLESSWKSLLLDEFEKDYMKNLRQFLRQELQKKKTIYPPPQEIFSALNLTPFHQVKVVIIGQDPYHGANQAHGLCFSVQKGIPLPPSLVNIFQELKTDLGIPTSTHGFLESWAKQGVLLLNSVLTVEASKAASHQGRGWEQFTDRIVELLNTKREKLIFVLWGSYADKKGAKIDSSRHLIIRCVHPSPLSAYRGFFGHRPFSRINNYLIQNGKTPIDWCLSRQSENVAHP